MEGTCSGMLFHIVDAGNGLVHVLSRTVGLAKSTERRRESRADRINGTRPPGIIKLAMSGSSESRSVCAARSRWMWAVLRTARPHKRLRRIHSCTHHCHVHIGQANS